MRIQRPQALRITFMLCVTQFLLACDTGWLSTHHNSGETYKNRPITGNALEQQPTSWEMSQLMDKQHFSITLRCQQKPQVGDFQQCHLLLVRGGEKVSDAKIAVDGGMKAHGHGLPTSPTVSATAIPGRYRIEGLTFSMRGEWVVGFKVLSKQITDQTVFTFSI